MTVSALVSRWAAHGAAILFLAVLSRQDLRSRELSLRVLAAFLAAGAAAAALRNQWALTAWLGDLAVGAGMLLVSAGSRGAVGRGDGLALLALGGLLGGAKAFFLLLGGLALAAVWGGLRILRGRGNRKQRLPFVPCLLAAELLWLLLGGD